MSDRVVLTVPARGEYAKAVRMTAAALVTRMGMSYDDVDDVRIAAEEAFVYACSCTTAEVSVDVVFSIDDDECAIEVGPVEHGSKEEEDEENGTLGRYAQFILQSVCDEFELTDDESGCFIRMTKRRAPVEGTSA